MTEAEDPVRFLEIELVLPVQSQGRVALDHVVARQARDKLDL